MKTKLKKHIRKCIPFVMFLFIFPCFSINSYAAEYEPVDFAWMYGGYDKYLGISQNGIAEIQISETRDILIRTIEQVNSTMYLSIYTPVNGMRHATIDIYDMDGELVEQIPCTDSYEINEPYDGLTNGYVSVDFINFEFSGNTFVLNTESANENYCIIILSKEKIVGSASDYSRVVQAIQDQTRTLNNIIKNQTDEIERGNELLENGNSNTDSVVSNFNEVFEDFNAELENIEEFDNSIIEQFEDANEQYLTELNNFSLSASLLNAGNWLSTSMQTVYDNSSDYKMLWLVPLLLGIPLIILFLRKGSDDE